MSQENVKVVLEAFARGRHEPDAWYAMLDPAVEWDTTRGMPDTQVVHGIAAVRDFFKSWSEAWDARHWEPRRTRSGGDQVVVEVRMSGRGRQSGLVTEAIFGQLYTFRAGRVIRYVAYPSYDEALEAAGLRE
ncbi:MAG: nuclear transport factor 2 family protein [Solirubrobacteraceae bacterium]